MKTLIKYLPKKTEILVAMAKKGLNQSSLSETADVNKSTLSLFMNGKKTISATTARKVADTLDCEVEELFEFKIDEVKQEV